MTNPKQPPQQKKSSSSLHNFEALGEQEVPNNINPYTHFYPLSEIKLEYKERRSILDEYHSDSKLRKSIFYGYFQLVFIFSCYFFVCHPVKKFLEEGKFLQGQLFEWLTHDLLDCLLLWPFMGLFLHLGYIIQKLRLPLFLEKILHFGLLISCVYIFAFWYTYQQHSDWLYTSRAFSAICTVACVIKMHSYMSENRELRKKNPKYIVSYGEFIYFVCAPAAIFQRKYPRTEKVEYKFLAIKLIFSLMGFFGIYILTTDWLLPVISQAKEKDTMTLLLELIEICFYFNLTVFYMIFESVMQCFGEMARFSDREFYRDWWNSTSYTEFFQKNNRPVDDFSRKYIREPLIQKYNFSSYVADLFCFAFTALTHEFVIIIVYQAFTPYVLIILILQIPFYSLFKKLEGTDWGNIVFWFIFLLAVPIVSTFYMKYDKHYLAQLNINIPGIN